MSAPRLYCKGKILGFKRSLHNQCENTVLLHLEGVQEKKDASFYVGKRVAYVYNAKTKVNGSKVRVNWGKITRTHGNTGIVKAQFKTNLPAKTFGAGVRVMLYPSSI